MKKICIASICAALSLTACDNGPKFHVEGKIENAKDSMLYLAALTTDGIELIDSAKLGKDGEFNLKGEAPQSPEFYALALNNHRIDFCIDSTETIRISADTKSMDSTYTVEGSECAQHIKEIVIMRSEMEKKIVAVERNESLYPGDITDSVTSMINGMKDVLVNEYIRKNPSRPCAYFALMQRVNGLGGSFTLFSPYNNRNDAKCYATVATSWQLLYPNTLRTAKLCKVAGEAMKVTAPKQEKVLEIDPEKVSETGIIDITLPDANSTMHSIKDLKGKVVLLDFTMYGVSESAERTHAMQALYDKYHEKGFEIYQISLDEDTHFWKCSVEKLPWICVHETNGRATNSYGVTTLPTFFLINRNNEVVLRSEMMEGTLESNIQKLL